MSYKQGSLKMSLLLLIKLSESLIDLYISKCQKGEHRKRIVTVSGDEMKHDTNHYKMQDVHCIM